MSTSTSPRTAGRRFAYVSSAARRPSNAGGGRMSAGSNSGPPTGPLRTAVANRHTSIVSCGSGLPVARIAAAPISRSSISTSGTSVSSASLACAATSGPIPSPGRRTTFSLPVGKRTLAERARLPAARARREARRLHGFVPAAEHARDGLTRRMILARLIPLARERRATVLAVPERDRVDDRLGRPAEAGARPRSHDPPPVRMRCLHLDTEGLQDLVCVRADAGQLEAVGHDAGRLQPVARDEQNDAIGLAELAVRDRSAQRTERDARCGLAEDPRRLGEQRDVVPDLVLADPVHPPPPRPPHAAREVPVAGTPH